MAWEDLESKLTQLENRLMEAEKAMRTISAEDVVYTVPSFRDYWRMRLVEERMLWEKRLERERNEKVVLGEQIENYRIKTKELEWRTEQLANEINQQKQLWEEKLKTKDAEYKLALKIKEEELRLEQGTQSFPGTQSYPESSQLLGLIEEKKELERRLEKSESERIEEKKKWEEEKKKLDEEIRKIGERHLDSQLIEEKKELERRLEKSESERIEEKKKWEERKKLENRIAETERASEGKSDEEIKKIEQELRKKYEESLLLHEEAYLHTTEELARGFAHRLRNSVGVISGLVQIILSDPAVRGVLKESLNSIVKTVDEMILQVEDFVKLSYIPKMQLRFSSVNSLLEEICSEVQVQCKQQKIELLKNFKPDLPMVNFDTNLLKEAILNIVVNSMEAMPTGGMLTLDTDLNGEKKEVIIRITDTGVGIPEHQLEQIYQPFFTTKKGRKGLGLSKTCRVVDLHHGLMKIESSKGKGTAVSIILPAVIA